MATETEIEAARCVIRDHIRAYWEATPKDAEEMVDGYHAMAKAALEAADRVRQNELRANCKHTNRQGSGNGTDILWSCRDCFKTWSEPVGFVSQASCK